MGHTRLGTLPKSRKWTKVTSFFLVPDAKTEYTSTGKLQDKNVTFLAQHTIEAALDGLQSATHDIGLRHVVFTLMQIALASREDNWLEAMRRIDIHISPESSPLELTEEFQRTIDDFLMQKGAVTDWSEMAQKAAGEALLSLSSSRSETLFGTNLQGAIRPLSTKKGFSDLGHEFFSRFMYHFLNFYLSRVTAKYTGGQRISNLQDLNQFNNILAQHCKESSKIVRDFCGGWYSKTNYEQGITIENTSRFTFIALAKIRKELIKQGAE